MPDPKTYHFKLPSYTGGLVAAPPNARFPGVEQHLPSCTSDRTLRGDGRIRAFVIHATAGSSSRGAITTLFSHEASWHWMVPDEDEPEHGRLVWACVPESRAAWHVRNSCSHPDVFNNSRNPNYWSIGVEIVNAQGNDQFSDWQVEQAAALVRYAWSRYPDLVDVVSHAKLDPTRRSDPGTKFPWERFRDLVLAPAAPGGLMADTPAEPLAGPIHIVSPSGDTIDCDPRLLDGVTVAEVRPLVEALGFRVEYDDGPPKRMYVLGGSPPRSPSGSKPKTAKRKTRASATSKRTRNR
jgi:hypothetical protein